MLRLLGMSARSMLLASCADDNAADNEGTAPATTNSDSPNTDVDDTELASEGWTISLAGDEKASELPDMEGSVLSAQKRGTPFNSMGSIAPSVVCS